MYIYQRLRDLREDFDLTQEKAAKILGIGVSTLDSLIPYSELPRTVIHKRVFIHRKELEKYITNCTTYVHQSRNLEKEGA